MNATQLKSWENAQPTLLKNSGKLYKKNKNLQKRNEKHSQKHHGCGIVRYYIFSNREVSGV